MSSSLSPWIRQFGALYCVAVLISGCGHEAVRQVPSQEAAVVRQATTPVVKPRSAAEKAAIIAVRQVGVPYRYGGASRQGFDCSGLVHFAYSGTGQRVPRTTGELWRRLAPVSRERLRVGDVLFFRIDGSISHVGLYLGNRRFVHAPATGRNVSVETLETPFYREAFVRGGRPPGSGSD
jgi:cell wall-associated NlpC family hydrolase